MKSLTIRCTFSFPVCFIDFCMSHIQVVMIYSKGKLKYCPSVIDLSNPSLFLKYGFSCFFFFSKKGSLLTFSSYFPQVSETFRNAFSSLLMGFRLKVLSNVAEIGNCIFFLLWDPLQFNLNEMPMPVDTVTARSIKVPWYQLVCLFSLQNACAFQYAWMSCKQYVWNTRVCR